MRADAALLLFLIFVAPVAAGLVCAWWVWVRVLRKRGMIAPEERILVERPWFILPGLVLLVLYVLAFLWGTLVEPDWVQVTRTEIRVSRPVLGEPRFRIVHLSDLHLEGEGARERELIRLVRKQKPHLILLTGDYLNTHRSAGTLVKLLTAMEAPFGIYGVPGNWDRKFEISALFRGVAEQRNAETPLLLKEDYKLIQHEGSKLLLLGLELTPHRSLSELLKGASPDAYRIFLAHSPDAVDQVRSLPPGQHVDLFLCGHTHGGQVRLPLWGAVIVLSRHHKKYEMGHYRIPPPDDAVQHETHMYVNRGVGMEGGIVPRVRFLCRPEVALIELVYEP